jgi:hypothetical protein
MPGGLAMKVGYCDAGLRLKLPQTEMIMMAAVPV